MKLIELRKLICDRIESRGWVSSDITTRHCNSTDDNCHNTINYFKDKIVLHPYFYITDDVDDIDNKISLEDEEEIRDKMGYQPEKYDRFMFQTVADIFTKYLKQNRLNSMNVYFHHFGELDNSDGYVTCRHYLYRLDGKLIFVDYIDII